MINNKFLLKSDYQPTGDQPQAIDKLVAGIERGEKNQVLLGVTGSGKTFTVASVIEKVQKPTLVIAHNKTLAAQLYQEFKEFFPGNAVSYFVSYYDFYQPEAYIPKTDTYIEKETEINEEIDKLRLAATTNLLTRNDCVVVSSVSCIYNLGSPKEYQRAILNLEKDSGAAQNDERKRILERLIDLQYVRNEFTPARGTFRVRGEIIDLFPSYLDNGLRIVTDEKNVKELQIIEPISGKVIENLDSFAVYPAKHYITDPTKYKEVFVQIRDDTKKRVEELRNMGKVFEAQRIASRVEYDLEMIAEVGFVNGIENYSRYFDGRNPGDPPFSLLDYFPPDYLLVIDESHMTIPQIRGMYNGDHSRKQTLIDFGFRLPAALDNRPLRFDEFVRRQGQTIYTSATPSDYEMSVSNDQIVEQLVRPTGLVDPEIEIRKTEGQIDDLIGEIQNCVAKKQRVLVTTLTKRLAEDITDYINERHSGNDEKDSGCPRLRRGYQNDNNIKIKVAYLHSDINTVERVEILKKLRQGEFDVLVGINLLREGLDLPEVALVAILDADKEGFLRSKTSLVQTMGRAARHIFGKVIMYADKTTDSMKAAIDEVSRRRKTQLEWNEKYHITPRGISKPIRDSIAIGKSQSIRERSDRHFALLLDQELTDLDIEQLTPDEKEKLKKALNRRMKEASKILDFEGAAFYRDKIKLI